MEEDGEGADRRVVVEGPEEDMGQTTVGTVGGGGAEPHISGSSSGGEGSQGHSSSGSKAADDLFKDFPFVGFSALSQVRGGRGDTWRGNCVDARGRAAGEEGCMLHPS